VCRRRHNAESVRRPRDLWASPTTSFCACLFGPAWSEVGATAASNEPAKHSVFCDGIHPSLTRCSCARPGGSAPRRRAASAIESRGGERMNTRPLDVPTGLSALSRGRHRDPTDGACLMEYTAFLAGEPHTDQPASVHPILAAIARVTNDALTDAERAALAPLAPRLLGTQNPDRPAARTAPGPVLPRRSPGCHPDLGSCATPRTEPGGQADLLGRGSKPRQLANAAATAPIAAAALAVGVYDQRAEALTPFSTTASTSSRERRGRARTARCPPITTTCLRCSRRLSRAASRVRRGPHQTAASRVGCVHRDEHGARSSPVNGLRGVGIRLRVAATAAFWLRRVRNS